IYIYLQRMPMHSRTGNISQCYEPESTPTSQISQLTSCKMQTRHLNLAQLNYGVLLGDESMSHRQDQNDIQPEWIGYNIYYKVNIYTCIKAPSLFMIPHKCNLSQNHAPKRRASNGIQAKHACKTSCCPKETQQKCIE
ncbi:hypothetical protein T310_0141, partial [Rasamsonia emersonii CBS 393.64]